MTTADKLAAVRERATKFCKLWECLELVEPLTDEFLALAELQQAQGRLMEVGNVLDHWEQLPNDIRTDPGFENLDAALKKLSRALLSVPTPAEPDFERWWMRWAFLHSKPQAKRNYTLGDAVRAAYEQGQAIGRAQGTKEEK